MKTKLVVQQHACGAGCACGKGSPSGPKGRVSEATVAVIQAAVTRGVAKAMAPVTPTLTQQVAAELKKPGNEHVIASVNEVTGDVKTYLAPKPYFETRNEDEIAPLRIRVTELEGELRRAPKSERARVQVQLDTAKRELERAEQGLEYERRRQRIGDLPA